MPGRKPAAVRKVFLPATSTGKIKKMACKFCKTAVADNGKRMTDHIQACKKCPADVKLNYTVNTSYQHPARESPAVAASTSSSATGKPTATDKCLSLPPGKMGRLESFADRITPAEQSEIDTALARAVFASGAPLSMTENVYWQAAFRKLRPAYSLPSRYSLTNTLLNAEYSRVNTSVNEEIASAQSLGLMCDGWSNIRNESIINFVVTTPKPVFYKSIASGSTSHTGEYMANAMLEIIKEIGSDKFVGVVTDNAANMKNAWTRIQEDAECPHIVCYGCGAHGIQLLLGDVCNLPSATDILQKAKAIVKEVNNSHRLRSMLSVQCTAMQCKQSLKMPVVTRWGSSIACLDSVLANKLSLRRLAIDEEAQSLLASAPKSSILSDVFWDQLVNLLELLRPVLKWITILEGDSPEIGATVEAFAELKDHFTTTLRKSPMTKKEEKQVLTILEDRKQFCLKTVHNAANLLDPRFNGKRLTEEAVIDACEYICMLSTRYNVSEGDVLADIANYRAKGGLWSKEFVWKSAQEVSPVVWWKGICSSRPLSKAAIDILSLPATSAACERSFSTYGNVHTARRNRMGNKTAMKLVYIAQNLKFCSTSSPIDHEIKVIIKPEDASARIKGSSSSVGVELQNMEEESVDVDLSEGDESDEAEADDQLLYDSAQSDSSEQQQ